jgi:hypothetical protein
MAADLYLREVDVLRFEVRPAHGAEEESCLRRVISRCWWYKHLHAAVLTHNHLQLQTSWPVFCNYTSCCSCWQCQPIHDFFPAA